MTKIFFFQRRDTNTGELKDGFLDAEERVAWDYYSNPRHYKYLGWSDGRFMLALQKELKTEKFDAGRDSRGISMQPPQEIKDRIFKAQKDELDFAIANIDKVPPRDPRKNYMRNSDKDALQGFNWAK